MKNALVLALVSLTSIVSLSAQATTTQDRREVLHAILSNEQVVAAEVSAVQNLTADTALQDCVASNLRVSRASSRSARRNVSVTITCGWIQTGATSFLEVIDVSGTMANDLFTVGHITSNSTVIPGPNYAGNL